MLGSRLFPRRAERSLVKVAASGAIVFWVLEETRWPTLLAVASQPDIGERVDKALDAIERDNPEQLRGVLPKIYARAPIQPAKLGSLVETIAKIGFGDDSDRAGAMCWAV